VAEAECLRSSRWSSWSCVRFVRDGADWGGLGGLSLCRGRSESGDFEFVDGAERRPERRISRGDNGGPIAIVAACAMAERKPSAASCDHPVASPVITTHGP